ncbi:hypothetical protein Pla163_06690 [Planctomycetes bacterium Pla163]|uniref:3-keto-alpha-glucoside-1,2-lyase/3-keto-2-hydroxy-glucal hydratase domain-containing protein n=1 Tax=Rohdeia mirabilis TaxID=2528008 RepID=A0A518CWI1_9BACT|nr:hypothetical protein Pla163_06690 [Planctomycetes bacterium Pla163]
MTGWAAFAVAAGLLAAAADGSSAEPFEQTSDERTVLFDGESLEGWTTRGGRYDGAALWTVEDGTLTGRVGENGAGGLIYTTRSYTCFDLSLECRMDHPYDSGVFVRMLPPDSGLKGLQATLDHRPGGEIAAIYADGFLFHNTEAEQYFAKDEWNSVRVRVTGFDPRVQVWINGRPVTDYRLPAGTPGFASRGLVGLQVHGADAEAASRKVQFRDISIVELDVFEDVEFDGADQKKNAGALHRALGGATGGASQARRGAVSEPATSEFTADDVEALTEVARDAGWRDLLAAGLDGWKAIGTEGGYEIAGGVLSIPADGSGHLVTVDDFTDFRLRLDFKIAEMANSGLFLRGARAGGDPAYSGCEIQILDDFNWEERTNSKLAPYQFTGGLYAAVAPGPDKEYRPPGEWNRYEVLVRGSRMAAALNGRLLFDVDTLGLDAKPPFAERAATGFIGLQRYGADSVDGAVSAEVRNMFVQPLAPLAANDAGSQETGSKDGGER